ncbi:uncharacterized protein HD556DRAFT_1309624 [Suillus plorans]|uniref:Uncharacterized protein n=1 Tax=Suillus plorans TaxID=116603 RepID=A0A9P7DG57_9AGAM|nr:uncharacterized protein HD556DRAFT_1309624 [Suillus plorans]KAG1792082.1 hypothetical protein HD556DRAFT_1309624 [Suillus plorans]
MVLFCSTSTPFTLYLKKVFYRNSLSQLLLLLHIGLSVDDILKCNLIELKPNYKSFDNPCYKQLPIIIQPPPAATIVLTDTVTDLRKAIKEEKNMHLAVWMQTVSSYESSGLKEQGSMCSSAL